MPKAKLDERHDTLLRFLQGKGQAWDTNELTRELGFSRQLINRLGKDLAEHHQVQLTRTETWCTLLMRAVRKL